MRNRPRSSIERLTTFQIGSIYGVSVRSLRFYEEQGLLDPVVLGGMRYFGAKDRIKLELILKGKRLGFGFLELKLLILTTAKENAARQPESPRLLPASKQIEKSNLVEEIWQTERKIDEMQSRLLHLQRRLDEA